MACMAWGAFAFPGWISEQNLGADAVGLLVSRLQTRVTNYYGDVPAKNLSSASVYSTGDQCRAASGFSGCC